MPPAISERDFDFVTGPAPAGGLVLWLAGATEAPAPPGLPKGDMDILTGPAPAGGQVLRLAGATEAPAPPVLSNVIHEIPALFSAHYPRELGRVKCQLINLAVFKMYMCIQNRNHKRTDTHAHAHMGMKRRPPETHTHARA